MKALHDLCAAAGIEQVQTYIASGNVVFRRDGAERDIRSSPEDRLRAYVGTCRVVVRTGSEIRRADAQSLQGSAGQPRHGAVR